MERLKRSLLLLYLAPAFAFAQKDPQLSGLERLVQALLNILKTVGGIIALVFKLVVVLAVILLIVGAPIFVYNREKQKEEQRGENPMKPIIMAVGALVAAIVAAAIVDQALVRPFVHDRGIIGIIQDLTKLGGG